MAKISLNDITTGFGSVTKFNANNTALEAEFNDKVLYRDNPVGEPNQMENDLDMNSNDILNISTMSSGSSGGVTGNRPSTPNNYQMYFDTTVGRPIWYNGTVWVDAAGDTV